MKKIIYFCALSLFFAACQKDDAPIVLGSITTTIPTSITSSEATSGGNITSDGGASISERGICYSTATDPSIADKKIISGNGLGSFVATMTGLLPGTTYYVKAYAINSAGTAYGNEVIFTTVDVPSVIVFQAGSGDAREIYKIDPEGANLQQLTTNAIGDYVPTISPDGSKIVFVRDGSLFTMNADGTGSSFLVAPSVEQVSYPSWSPDGTKIAYIDIETVGFFDFEGEIKIVSSSGQAIANLTPGSTHFNQDPSWSPDGSNIIHVSWSDASVSYGIFTVLSSGGIQAVFLDGSESEYRPSYSPDGMKVVFDANNNIFTLSSDGSGTTVQLTTDNSSRDACWSPNGDMIAFTTNISGKNDIWIMNVDGSNKVNVTNTPNVDEGNPSWGRKQ